MKKSVDDTTGLRSLIKESGQGEGKKAHDNHDVSDDDEMEGWNSIAPHPLFLPDC